MEEHTASATSDEAPSTTDTTPAARGAQSSETKNRDEDWLQRWTSQKLAELSPPQLAALEEMESLYSGYKCSYGDPQLELDVHLFLRFLRARNFEVAESKIMLDSTIRWRETVRPDLIQPVEIEEELICGKGYWHGFDKEGCPCIIVNAAQHVSTERDLEQCKKFTMYTAEKGIALMKLPVERFVILYEPKGLSRKNFDITMIREFIKIASNYPDRLKMIYVLKAPWVYSILLQLCRPFVEKQFYDKIAFISDYAQLLEFFTPENLLEQYGGTSTFVYSYTPTRPLKVISSFSSTESASCETEPDADLLSTSK